MPRLILGAGKRAIDKQKGDLCVDIRYFPGIDVTHDLNIVPWAFAHDNHYSHVSAVHLIEHLDSLVDFMNECHRVLIPGGSLYMETPLAGVNPDLEWADPTHKRCYRIHTFINYFSPEGIEAFGYTDKAWNFFVLRVENDCIILHAYPIKQ